jgi:hypothetical protein
MDVGVHDGLALARTLTLRAVATLLSFAALGTLSGCSNPDDLSDTNLEHADSSASPLQLTPLATEARRELYKEAQDEQALEKLEAKANAAMANYLFDPGSAQYLNLRLGKQGAVCGQYNAKNRYAAYVGFKDFVILPDGQTLLVSDYNDGVETSVYGTFAEAFLKFCATPQQVKAHARSISPVNQRYENLSAENLVAEDDMELDPFAD